MEHDTILVLDFGSQYNQLIARRIRDFGVYSELLPPTTTAEQVKQRGDVKGIIFSGGPNVITDPEALLCDPELFNLDIPVLGICYGMQLMAHYFNGEVVAAQTREYGQTAIELLTDSPLVVGLERHQVVLMSHGYHVTKVPTDFSIDAKTATTPIVMMSNEAKQLYGVQFHPEVRHTEHGIAMLQNFVFHICHAKANWSMEHFIEEEIASIRETVGQDQVLCALSGGVDSSVVATLLQRAIGDQLTCVFVDHGLLRKDEGDQVMEALAGKFSIHIIRVNAQERFLNKLVGVSDPEQKRKIIGEEFIRVFEEEQKKLTDVKWLAQGTLYADIIESGTDTARVIKSHHNVGGLPKDMNFRLIEPVKALFKDEVRALGMELGLAEELVWRQPFPGPGLAVRVIGDITTEKLEIVRNADAIVREEIVLAGLGRDIWQYFAILTNIKSVGVMGDERTYDYAVGIRAVTSIDGMTADFAKIPWEILQKITVRIVNEVKHVNRVVYDVTSKPPGTIELE